jgi:hypothetical protein
MKSFGSAGLACGMLVASILAAGAASASTSFPDALRKELGLATIAGPPPGCRLCHQDDLGGLNTATKPFGRSLRKAGAMGGAVNSLILALRALDADAVDSDGDGTPDVAELRAGTDPNVSATPGDAPATPDDIPLPETGCTLAAPRALGDVWLLLAGALCALAWRRR